MSNLEQIKLVRNSQALLMYREPGLSPVQAIEKLQNLIAGSVAVPPVSHTEYPFWSALTTNPISEEVFTELKTSPDAAFTNKLVKLCKDLSTLKFNDEERFALLMAKSREQIEHIEFTTDCMRNFIKNMSELMTKENLTLQEAIEKSFKQNYIANLYLVTRDDSQSLISQSIKVEIYWHARIGLMMWQDSYKGGHPEEASFQAYAQFHIAHQDKIFRELDKELAGLKFSIKECTQILEEYANNTQALKEKIAIMKTVTPKIAELMDGAKTIAYHQAKAAVLHSDLNAAENPLNDQEFQRLLSKPIKARFNEIARNHNQTLPAYTPSPVTYVPAARALNNSSGQASSVNMGLNIDWLAGLGIATAAVVLLAFFRVPRKVLTSPYRFFKNTGTSMLRYFNAAETETTQRMEIVVSEPHPKR